MDNTARGLLIALVVPGCRRPGVLDADGRHDGPRHDGTRHHAARLDLCKARTSQNKGENRRRLKFKEAKAHET